MISINKNLKLKNLYLSLILKNTLFSKNLKQLMINFDKNY